MATTYNASLELSFIKRHQCCGCEAEFQYRIHRKVTGSGGNQAAAQANLEVAAVKSLENDVDQHACPHCGLLQPDMLAARRSGVFTFAGVLAGVAAIIGLIMAGPDLTQISTSAIVASIGVVLALLLTLKAALTNPNSNMIQQQEKSQSKVDQGEIELISEGNHSESMDRFGGLTGGHIIGISVLGIAAFACVLPLILPVASGWTMNDSYPPVIGPGESTRIYFTDKIRSLEGIWNGSAAANIVEGEQINLRARTKQDPIGNSIEGDTSTRQMYVDLQFPQGDYAGREFRINMKVDAQFPQAQGTDSFIIANQTFQATTDLTLSDSGSGSTYSNSWLGGQLFAIVAAVIAVFTLRRTNSALAAQANPTKVIDQGGDELPGEEASEQDAEEYEDEAYDEYEDDGYDDYEDDGYDDYADDGYDKGR